MSFTDEGAVTWFALWQDVLAEDWRSGMTMVERVCASCSEGRPICTDRKPDGGRYSHAETCAWYEWSDVCARCEQELFEETAA